MSTTVKYIIGFLAVAIVGYILYKRSKKKDINGPLEVKRYEINKSDDGSVITGAVDVVRNYDNGLSSITRVSGMDFSTAYDRA